MNEYANTLTFYVSSEDLPSFLYLPANTLVFMKNETILIKLEDAIGYSKVGTELDDLGVEYKAEFIGFTFEIIYKVFCVPGKKSIF